MNKSFVFFLCFFSAFSCSFAEMMPGKIDQIREDLKDRHYEPKEGWLQSGGNASGEELRKIWAETPEEDAGQRDKLLRALAATAPNSSVAQDALLEISLASTHIAEVESAAFGLGRVLSLEPKSPHWDRLMKHPEVRVRLAVMNGADRRDSIWEKAQIAGFVLEDSQLDIRALKKKWIARWNRAVQDLDRVTWSKISTVVELSANHTATGPAQCHAVPGETRTGLGPAQESFRVVKIRCVSSLHVQAKPGASPLKIRRSKEVSQLLEIPISLRSGEAVIQGNVPTDGVVAAVWQPWGAVITTAIGAPRLGVRTWHLHRLAP